MIKKLLKYDLKKMSNLLIYLYPIALAVSILTRLIKLGDSVQLVFIISQVFAGITYSIIGSILVNTFVQILVAFNQSFYKDQSYLTHTLPVEKQKLLLSKYLSALIIILTSIVVSVVSLFIVLYTKELMQGLKGLIQMAVSGFNMSGTAFILLIAGIFFAQICFLISAGFTAIVKAHTYNEKRTLKGLIWFVIYYMASMLITFTAVALALLVSGNIKSMFLEVLPANVFTIIMVTAVILYVLFAITFYFMCNRLFKKGVNVD
ncbi:MAG: hypothetical protein E7342_05745 [Clostridiales bacterium]|nr:hypothetical protein [Clostridiales bacterium]